MKALKTTIIAALFAVCLAPVFAGGSKDTGASGGKITITLLDSFVPGESLTPAVESALKKFQAQYPNVTIEREVIANETAGCSLSTNT